MHTQTGVLSLPDAQIAYTVTGDGYPLTLIHAGVADQRLWNDQAEFFSDKGFRIIRYDMRGYGDTRSQTKEGFSDADDLLALLDFLKIEKTHLLGMSRGGALAVDFTLAHPDRVTSLIPIAAGLSGFQPQGKPTDAEVAFDAEVQKVEASGDLDKLNELEVHYWLDGLHRAGSPPDQAAQDLMLAMNGRALRHPDGMLSPKDADPPAADRLSTISVPTLVIWGDGDESVVQAMCAKMSADIPNARYQIFPDVAHMVNLDRPAAFNQIVFDFLSSVPIE